MRSIKPGRGPSMMGGFGAVCSVVFGIFWTVLAASMTRGTGIIGVIFPLFGVLFIIIGICNAVYHFKNAASKNRYSAFDITDETEEPDPLNERFGDASTRADTPRCGYTVLPLLRRAGAI